MTTTAAFAHSFPVAGSGRSPRRRLSALPSIGASLLPRTWRRIAKAADACGTPPGPIGAAVIKATRQAGGRVAAWPGLPVSWPLVLLPGLEGRGQVCGWAR